MGAFKNAVLPIDVPLRGSLLEDILYRLALHTRNVVKSTPHRDFENQRLLGIARRYLGIPQRPGPADFAGLWGPGRTKKHTQPNVNMYSLFS